MAPVKLGDYVQVLDREVTSADTKSGLYYEYFKGVAGTIERLYDDNSVCIDVEIDSLPEDVKQRHIEIQTMQRDKWINGLSQEQRNKLTEADKQFKMSYKIVVGAADVAPAKKGAKPKSEAKSQKKADTVVKAEEESSKRLTEDDISAAEEAFLQSQANKDGK